MRKLRRTNVFRSHPAPARCYFSHASPTPFAICKSTMPLSHWADSGSNDMDSLRPNPDHPQSVRTWRHPKSSQVTIRPLYQRNKGLRPGGRLYSYEGVSRNRMVGPESAYASTPRAPAASPFWGLGQNPETTSTRGCNFPLPRFV